MARVKKSFTPILVDGDDPANADFGGTYGLHYYPSIVFADAEGASVKTMDGVDAESFKAAVEELAK